MANLLHDAMGEQERRSETSSSKSYEVVRVEGANNNSGQTSGGEDELDTNTTTSSDIEVISSPNQMGGGGHGSRRAGRNGGGYGSNGSESGRSWQRLGEGKGKLLAHVTGQTVT